MTIIRTVADLAAQLADCDPDAEVRIAWSGDSVAFSYFMREPDEYATGDDGMVVYLPVASEDGYLPREVRENMR